MWLAPVMHKSPLVLGWEVPAMGLQETQKMCLKQHEVHHAVKLDFQQHENNFCCIWFVISPSDLSRNIARKALLMLIVFFQFQSESDLKGT